MDLDKIKRSVEDKTILDNFVEDFCAIIEKHAKYIICSGFVAIAHGRARGTEDIDMITEKIPENKFVALHKDLVKNGFICMQSEDSKEIYASYLEKGESVRYVRNDEGLFPPEMEIKFAKDKLDEDQIKERVILPLTHLNVYFSSIESNIAFKEEYLRSEKDIEDAKHLRLVYKGKINEGKINKTKEEIKKIKKYGKR